MLRSLNYSLSCDECSLLFGVDNNSFKLQAAAERAGWALNRRRDGQFARRAGKDYCPGCAPATPGSAE